MALLFCCWHCIRLTVDEQRGNEDKAVHVDTVTGILKKTPRPGMGTVMANERVGELFTHHDGKTGRQEGHPTCQPSSGGDKLDMFVRSPLVTKHILQPLVVLAALRHERVSCNRHCG